MKKWLIIAFFLCLSFMVSSCGSNGFKDMSDISTVTIMAMDKDDKPSIVTINFSDSYVSYPKGVKRTITEDETTKIFDTMKSLGLLSMPNKPYTSNRYEISILTKDGNMKTFGSASTEYPDYLIDFIRKTSEILNFDLLTNSESYTPLTWNIKLIDTNNRQNYSINGSPSSDPNFNTYYPQAKIGIYKQINEEDVFAYALNNKTSLQKDRTNMVCKMEIQTILYYAEIKKVIIEDYDSERNLYNTKEFGLPNTDSLYHFSYDKTIPSSRFGMLSLNWDTVVVWPNHYYVFTIEDTSGNYYITAIYVS